MCGRDDEGKANPMDRELGDAQMLLLTFRDLRYRKVRFIVVTLLGALVFALLFVITGLVEQFNLEPVDRSMRSTRTGG